MEKSQSLLVSLLCLSGCGTACLHCNGGFRFDLVLDVRIAVTASRAVVCVACTAAEYSTSAWCFLVLMALPPSRSDVRHVCTEAEYSTSICCLVVHIAAAASCGGANLERKECDEIF